MPDKDYQKIFTEYQELKARTHIEAQTIKPGESYEPVYINGNDLTRRYKLRDELEDNLDKLTDEQLKKLYQDNDLAAAAVKVLAGRSINIK